MRNVLKRRIAIPRSSSLIIALLAGSCLSAEAQEIGDTEAGRHLAENWCSGCHVVGMTSQRGTSTGAPDIYCYRAHEIYHADGAESLLADTAQPDAGSPFDP
jgi:mono/diheme cytochrome c family protein